MEILPDSAIRIFGRDFLGPQVVEQILTVQDGAFPTPLSSEELLLEQARQRGELLIHRVDKTPRGEPLTMHWMVEALQARFDREKRGQILYGPSLKWCQDQAFFMEATPRPGLAFVSKEPIPGSTRKNYWQQTDLLAGFVNDVYKWREVPSLYKDALDEWAEEKARLNTLLTSDWRGAAKGLAELQLNQQFGTSPVEDLFDTMILYLSTGERRLKDVYNRTNVIASGGLLVFFGGFFSLGAFVFRWYPSFGGPVVGVCSSRSYL